MTKTPVRLLDLFKYYREQPHQLAAITELESMLLKAMPDCFNREQPWFKTWSQGGKVDAKPQALEIQQQPAKLTPDSSFNAHLTPHVQLGEFALYKENRRFDYQFQVDTAAELAAFLERVRVNFGNKPIVITSGYRPPSINRAVGGASSSEHLYSNPGVGAVDFYIEGADINAVQSWCDKNWPYSLGYGAPKGFVHLGIRGGRTKLRWDY